MSADDLIIKIKELSNLHETKKLEINNLTLLTDKKIAELLDIEKKYAELVFELNKKNKENVIR